MNLCTLFVFVSIVEFVIISRILSVYNRPRKHNRILNKDPRAEPTSDEDEEDLSRVKFGPITLPKAKEDGTNLAISIDRASRVVIPTLFVMLNTAFWIFYAVDW